MSALLHLTRPVDFDRLYRQHVATVYRYAFAVLGNHADAEDVTQQTFLNAYRAIERGTKPRKAQNWLLRIAHNEVRRHFRSAQAKPREVELDERRLPHDVPERSEPSLAEVLRALQHLSPTQREALVMREFEGRSYAEIAQLMNMTPSALEGQIFRARRALAEHLEGAFTCTEAEEALLRRLDERLPRRIGRRLKAHLQECHGCVRFADVQKRQRAVLKGLSVMPIPASLFLYRPEQAAAAGLGASAVAAGGSAAIGGGAAGAAGAGGTGVAAGFMAKAAAVTAAAAAAGGVGYGVTIKPDALITPERAVAHKAMAAETPQARRATPIAAPLRRVEQPATARKRTAPAPRKADRPKKQHVNHAAPVKATRKTEKAAAKDSRAWKHAAPLVKPQPAKAAAKKAAAAKVRARPAGGKKTGHTRPARPKPVQAQRGPAKPKPALNPAPAPPPNPGRGPKEK